MKVGSQILSKAPGTGIYNFAMMSKYLKNDKLKNKLNGLKADSSVVILTGAGVSAPSGISTFRDQNGLWENHNIMEVATPEGFQSNPNLVHKFYNARRAQLKTVKPNGAHKSLVEWELKWPGDLLLVTQNVDDLHQRAGSRKLIAMHGELNSIFCTLCTKKSNWDTDLGVDTKCPNCGISQSLRPDIVWFGEMPYRMAEIDEALEDADLFLSIGTSGSVYPAGNFVLQAHKALRIEINRELTSVSELFDATLLGDAESICVDFVGSLLSGL